MSDAALSLTALTKRYASGLEALCGIDLSVEPGDFFALLGPNGAGKSTAIGIISSLITKTSGKVHVFGNDLDREPALVKSCLGLVPQEFNFNQFEPVAEILVNQAGFHGIPRQAAWREAELQLRRLDLWEKRAVPARELSGGMKRRLMIARALVHRPRLLILDEPTAGVDIEIRRSMWTFLREINQEGTTIILTTHYLEEAESLCRNIAIIDLGKIAEHTSMESLLDRLHREEVVLQLQEVPAHAPKLSGAELIEWSGSNLTLSIDREAGINGLFEQLTRQGLQVRSMRNRQNRLERLMLEMADRRATQNGKGIPRHSQELSG